MGHFQHIAQQEEILEFCFKFSLAWSISRSFEIQEDAEQTRKNEQAFYFTDIILDRSSV